MDMLLSLFKSILIAVISLLPILVAIYADKYLRKLLAKTLMPSTYLGIFSTVLTFLVPTLFSYYSFLVYTKNSIFFTIEGIALFLAYIAFVVFQWFLFIKTRDLQNRFFMVVNEATKDGIYEISESSLENIWGSRWTNALGSDPAGFNSPLEFLVWLGKEKGLISSKVVIHTKFGDYQ